MTDKHEHTESKLLLESEVAERLRCSTSKIKRLRSTGMLAYIPGRPVLIEESALEEYIQSIRVEVATKEADKADRLWQKPDKTQRANEKPDAAERATRKFFARRFRQQMRDS